MVKGEIKSTRRGFVKGVAAGTAAVAVAGALTAGSASTKESLETRLEALEKRLQQVEDVQAIQRLQYGYNYYVEHMMKQEVIDCFSDSPDVLLDWLEGKWKGKAGVRKYFDVNQVPPVGFRHQLIPSAGLITLAPEGKTAKGRWYAFGGIMTPMPAKEGEPPSFSRRFIDGIYEMGYVKEDGVWKIKVLDYHPQWHADFETGWAHTRPAYVAFYTEADLYPGNPVGPDALMDPKPVLWPETEVVPFHYPHPVRGHKQERPKAKTAA